ncbi:unnamed protein product, partial [Rotaria magnacalcarata]
MIYLDNILKSIDPALLRPGRIEKVIKVEFPNASARSAIFDIYTEAVIRNAALHQDVDINHIIQRTEGLTGAHVNKL